MRKSHVRVALVVMVVACFAAIATPRAQRGYNYRQSYSGNVRYDGRFVFMRISYPWFGGRGAPWAHDWPRGEEHFLKILSEITATPTHITESSIMGLSDPELFKFPVAYMAEPGFWSMSDADVTALRAYLAKGGFLILDDFRGGREWSNVEFNLSKAFPEARWEELGANHPIFHSFFEINSLDIVPQAYDAGRPSFRAYFENNDPNKRIMVIAAFNTDISEFWEWSDTGYAPIDITNEAYKLGINLFMYGMTH